MEQYVIGIDQSTQGTKAILFDGNGRIMEREDLAHRQIINEKGWVEHDPEEIYGNTIQVVKNLVNRSNINKRNIAGIGISNQRETALAWDKVSGRAFYNAIVWQCARGEQIAGKVRLDGYAEPIRMKTGLKLSPYFSAAKLAWIMQNIEEAANASKKGTLCLGTIDSWLIYRLTGGKEFRADYSNSCRTQLFNINTLQWDSEICRIFDIPISALPEVTPSDAYFGETD
ncbi:MAG: glycerol kinase, partial [Butyrivibrio sp.]|nr:glycerol kinase [Butyrivibrio sp.]